jgi:hypothetical protein
VAVAATIYPASLPCVSRIDGYGLNQAASLVRTPFEAGNARQRRWNFVLPTEIQLTWRCTNEQLHQLFAWLNTYGYDWFQLDTSSLESSIADVIAVPIDVRLTSDLQMSLMPIHFQNYWAVKANAVYSPTSAVLAEFPDPDPEEAPTLDVEDTLHLHTADGGPLVNPPTYFLAHFDSNFNDVVGGQTGTALGSPLPALNTTEKMFGAASTGFNGNTGRVAYPGTGSSGLWNGAHTFECWIRATAIGGGVNRILFSSDLVGGSFYQLFSFAASGGGPLSISNRGSNHNTGWIPSLNTWYAIAYSCEDSNPTNGFKFFVDGALIFQETPVINVNASSAAFRIGNGPSDDQAFVGQIDEVRITRGVRYSAAYTPSGPFPDV